MHSVVYVYFPTFFVPQTDSYGKVDLCGRLHVDDNYGGTVFQTVNYPYPLLNPKKTEMNTCTPLKYFA